MNLKKLIQNIWKIFKNINSFSNPHNLMYFILNNKLKLIFLIFKHCNKQINKQLNQKIMIFKKKQNKFRILLI